MHETTQLLIEVGALLLVLSLLGRVAARFGFSAIPLYLLAGLAVGHGGLLPLQASEEFFEIGSQIGVILLLAMLGLEYSAEELVSNLKTSRVSGILDGVFNALPGAAFALLLGWEPVAVVALAGVTWVSSSGVIAKVVRDLGRLGNRETPVVLSILVMEDLAMAFYLPVLSALVIGAGLMQGAITVAVPLRRSQAWPFLVTAPARQECRSLALGRCRAHDARCGACRARQCLRGCRRLPSWHCDLRTGSSPIGSTHHSPP